MHSVHNAISDIFFIDTIIIWNIAPIPQKPIIESYCTKEPRLCFSGPVIDKITWPVVATSELFIFFVELTDSKAIPSAA